MWGIAFLLLGAYLFSATYRGNLVSVGETSWEVFKGFFPFLMLIIVFSFLAQKGPAVSREIFTALAWLIVASIIVAHGSDFFKNFSSLLSYTEDL